MEKRITTPLTAEVTKDLHVGDNVLLTGVIYTGRDAAHKRLVELLEQGKELPVDMTDGIIYYVGPAPAQPGQVIGSAGPTTSYRMDAYAPALLDLGLKGMIGKGKRSAEVVESMKKNDAIYFGAIGGCGALLAKCIKKAEVVAYEDLGAEAIRRLEVENLPLTVIIDSEGNNQYELGRKEFLAMEK
ncbi:MAG: Fe-S-containing hydro-lyase [Firmicutes bacterium]|nr:Fe-S-containing hydro-lyase [Bacillota bacterium]